MEQSGSCPHFRLLVRLAVFLYEDEAVGGFGRDQFIRDVVSQTLRGIGIV